MDKIWYAGYSSNLSTSRFLEYISNFGDKTLPEYESYFEISYQLYCAKNQVNGTIEVFHL